MFSIFEASANVKQKILDIDRAFLEAAPRNENNSNVYFRGMQRPFEKLANIHTQDPSNQVTPDSGGGGDLGWFG